MQDAAVDRMLRVLSRSPNDGRGRRKKGKPREEGSFHLRMEEGWLSLFLLAAVVYSTIWCVQAVGWVDNLNVLTLTTLFGLVAGVLASKQYRFPSIVVHVVVMFFGLFVAFWQTAGAFHNGSFAAFAGSLGDWFNTVLHGGFGNDDSIFLFFIVTLGFVLAYTSAWLVYRTRSPWLMIIANAVVLLINLSNTTSGYIIFLVIFLLAALLLVLRFNLYESIKRWNRQGLRYSEDLGWDIMQAGALISIGILIFSWILPYGYTDPNVAQIWTVDSNPWVQLQNTWDRIISVNGGVNAANRGSFRDTLTLGGNPNLNNEIVFTVQSDDGSQYLQSTVFDTYTDRGWTISPTSNHSLKAKETNPLPVLKTRPVTQRITVVNQPALQYPYLFGAPQIVSANSPASLMQSRTTGETTAWLNQNGFITGGNTYTVTSDVSSADEASLRAIPLPKDATSTYSPSGQASADAYDPDIVRVYTQLPQGIDPQIGILAQNITRDKKAMYDKVLALETYLRANYAYDLNINKPPREEGVSWFLFRSHNRGFCNYFSSAMAVMARSLGIPARVVVGYTNGNYDTKTHQRVIRGVDAHAWTQVYFAGYGWINFEPSQSFATFSRPLPDTSGNGSGSTGNLPGGPNAPNNPQNQDPRHKIGANDSLDGSGTNASASGTDVGRSVSVAAGSLILLLLFGCILFGVWWRKLFRNLSVTSQVYGRVCMLADWAGIRLQLSNTPTEYMDKLAQAAPNEAEMLHRLGDIYTRERWAPPESPDHPKRNGDLNEIGRLWQRLQPRLFLYLARHPYFLRWGPRRLLVLWREARQRRKQHKMLYDNL